MLQTFAPEPGLGILGRGYDRMARTGRNKTGRKTAKRTGKAGRGGVQAKKSSVSQAGKPGSRKAKPTKTDPRKPKPSPRSETAGLKRQLKAARMQQEASAEILRAVANTSGNAAGPLQLIAETTARLFKASSVSVQLAEGSEFTQEYRVGAIAKRVGSAYPRSNIRVGGRNLPGTVVAESRQIHIPDLDRLDPSMSDFPGLPHARAGGARTVCGTPLRRDDKAIGALIVFRDRLLPFTGDELALLQSLADQAVIAIENARLFNETREAFDRQTATGDVLRIISRSVAHAAPVFDTILESCQRLFDPYDAAVYLVEGDRVRGVAQRGPAAGDWGADSMPLEGSSTGMAIAQRQPVHFPDLADKADLPEDKRAVLKQTGGMTVLYAPMISQDGGIGSLVVTRRPKKPFTETEIDFIQSFADQAVIAIENSRLFNETKEALERQTATSEILRVISQSPTDVQPVFDAIVQAAVRLIRCEVAFVLRCDGATFSPAAAAGPDGPLPDLGPSHLPIDPDANFPSRAIVGKKNVYLPDWSLIDLPEHERQMQALIGVNSALFLPLLREGECIGVLALADKKANIFGESEIALAESFRDQALIAIENARLFNETEEALERQTATAEILKVIASSPDDLQPVFEAIAERSNRLVSGLSTTVLSIADDTIHLSAFTRTNPEADAALTSSFPRQLSKTIFGEPIRQGAIYSLPDTETEPSLRDLARLRGYRSMLFVPLLRDGAPIGMIGQTRVEPGPFADHHVEMLKTFADQAVIAIENARLFGEVQARTRDLSEALEQQTATSAVLAVISRSPSDLNPVLEAISDTAARLCGSEQTMFFRYDGNVFRILASWNFPPEVHEMLERRPLRPGHPSAIGRAGASLKPVCIPDVLADPAYGLTGEQSRARYRATLAVPLLREGQLVGALSLNRSEPGAFTEKQIELVTTFADQAVIAIENTRLFNETQEALARQTATSDILRVISGSPTDVQPVFNAIVQTAVRLIGCDISFILGCDGAHFWSVARCGKQGLIEITDPRRGVVDPDANFPSRAIVGKQTLHLPDWAEIELPPFERQIHETLGYKSAVYLPLLRDSECIGVLGIAGTQPRMFREAHIALAESFRDQAVIAIENTRLFNETQEALERQTATADILKVIASSPDDVQPVFQAIAERSNQLVGGFATTVGSIVDDVVHLSAFTSTTPAADAALGAFYPRPLSEFSYGDAVRRGETHRIVDIELEPGLEPDQLTIVRQRGWRSALWVPLLLEGKTIGVIGVTRVAPGAFADHHVDMLKTFADQAVIAISNVKLFRQVQERTRELSRSLDELRTAQDRLVQTEKLASLGQLTAGIAHEIKNPLNFVNNFSALSVELIDEMTDIFENPTLDEAGRRKELDEIRELLKSNLEKVVQHGKRADSIVKNMLLHSREGSGEQRPADINALLDESLNLAYHGARAEKPDFNITLQRDLDPQVGAIDVFPQEITRAFINLISNGFYAADKRKAENGEENFEPILSAATRNLGSHVEVRIRDNGTGIPAEVKEKMFNPFFTTKPAGEGTGLGLSMSHDIIVKQHGGRIEVDTQPGQFTEFTVVLPRAANPANNRKS